MQALFICFKKHNSASASQSLSFRQVLWLAQAGIIHHKNARRRRNGLSHSETHPSTGLLPGKK